MSESIQVIGTIKVIQDTETFPSGFSKRIGVITTPDDKYPQDIAVEFFKDKTELLDSFSVGDEVSATCNLRGREYNDKYYVSLNAWQIKRIGNVNQEPMEEYGEQMSDVDDDLNF